MGALARLHALIDQAQRDNVETLALAFECDRLFYNYRVQLDPQQAVDFAAGAQTRGITPVELCCFVQLVNDVSPLFTAGDHQFLGHRFDVGAERGGNRVVYIGYPKMETGIDWDAVAREVLDAANAFEAFNACVTENSPTYLEIRAVWQTYSWGYNIGERETDQ